MTMATIIKRGKSYAVKYRGPDKKQRWESFKRKKDADARVIELEHQLYHGRFIEPKDLQRTVGEAWKSFKATRWGSIRKGTQAFYEGAYRVHIEKTWAHQRLRGVDTEAIERWQTSLQAEVGDATVSHAVSLLGRIFRHALRYRWVDANPVAVAVKVKPKGKVLAWTPDQIAAMLDKADADTAVFLRVAISTGARLGELSGLRWSDIDLTTGIVSIAQQYTAGSFSELKTDNSRRRIPLPQEVLKQLKLWKLRCPRSDEGLVFPSTNGSPLDASNFHHRVWRPLLKAAKLPHGRFHALRHSFASALITDNQSPKLVQTLLGHHSAAFTMDVYSDLWPTALDGIGERIAVTLFSGDGSKVVANEGSDSSKDEPRTAEVIDMIGGPCRDRTYDQEIKSLLLYQLS
jgi:integrase